MVPMTVVLGWRGGGNGGRGAGALEGGSVGGISAESLINLGRLGISHAKLEDDNIWRSHRIVIVTDFKGEAMSEPDKKQAEEKQSEELTPEDLEQAAGGTENIVSRKAGEKPLEF